MEQLSPTATTTCISARLTGLVSWKTTAKGVGNIKVSVCFEMTSFCYSEIRNGEQTVFATRH